MKKTFHISLKRISFLLLISILISDLNSFSEKSINENESFDYTSKITFSAVGDLMCHSVQYNYAKTDSGYDFTGNFEIIKGFFYNSDFTIGNLETVLAGKERGYSGYPLFNSPDEYLYAIKDAGFDFLVTANNHSLDKGKKGLLRTIDKIREVELSQTGTFKSINERDSIYVKNINGISFTLLAYSYGTNGIPISNGEDFLINLIDTTLIKSDITKAKQNDIDLIIVYFHFGNEYKREPSAYQKNIVKQTINYGADIIIGSHPHVPQPLEYFKTNNRKLDSGFVAYSLGNFISNQRWRYSDGGPILNFSVGKDFIRDSLFIEDVTIIPTWVFKGNRQGNLDYVILPSDSVINKNLYPFMTKKDWKDYKQSYKDIVDIMSSKSKNIRFHSPHSELLNFIKKIRINSN